MSMKKFSILFLSFILVLTSLISCESLDGKNHNDEDRFLDLIAYCRENAQQFSDGDGTYFKLSWTDIDSSETGAVDFTVNVYENRKITITGKSNFPHNSGIENEVVYNISFVYGSHTDTKINYQVDFSMKMIKLKDAYNYSPYVLDEVRMSDTKAIFNIDKWTASCYYENFSSDNNVIDFDDRNDTLRSVSVDSFNQLKNYFNERANISLFGK